MEKQNFYFAGFLIENEFLSNKISIKINFHLLLVKLLFIRIFI